ncbi:hypothetical protein D3C83_149230 [compost metagenome]
MRMRGVMMLSAVRSPSRITRCIMLRSSESITPCSWLSLTSIWISSSVMVDWSTWPSPSTRITRRVAADNATTTGLAALAKKSIG